MHDLILVGAGTAGCVLAERLTRSGKLRVLLIEAGGPPKNRFVSIPAGFAQLFKSEVDWAFESEPQIAVGGRRIFTPRGKMLGGSSNLNAQMHQWCHPADFDGWVADGADGWSWNEVAHVFKQQEQWLGDDGDDDRGREGPMTISPNRNVRHLSKLFVESARRAGFGTEEYYNGRAYDGAWVVELAHKNGKRFSAYNAYLEPAMRRPNLEIMDNAHATKIIVENGRATGVTVLRDGKTHDHRARGVILSAGTFGSPQLLLLSGIGPQTELERLGIEIALDSPHVGDHLQDHPVLPILFNSRSKDTFKSAQSPLNLVRYLLFKRGMLASNAVEGFAFKQVGDGSARAPDLEIMFVPLEYRNQFLEPPQVHAWGMGSVVVAPRSRGRLSLQSADPVAPPKIDFGLLTDPDGFDASVLCEGIRLSRQIAATPPLAEQNAGELRPGSQVEADEDILDYASREIQTVYHPTSTCRMGPETTSVVDPKLRVHGVDGLWVADASVMPTVPRGHPNAVVAMIANRASEWIETALTD